RPGRRGATRCPAGAGPRSRRRDDGRRRNRPAPENVPPVTADCGGVMNRFPAERLLGPMLLLVGLVLAGCASPGAAGSPADDNPDRPVAGPTGTPPATSAAPAPEPDPTTGALLVTVHAPDGTPLADACLDIQPLDPGLPPLPEDRGPPGRHRDRRPDRGDGDRRGDRPDHGDGDGLRPSARHTEHHPGGPRGAPLLVRIPGPGAAMGDQRTIGDQVVGGGVG